MPRLLIVVAWVCVIGLAIFSMIVNFLYDLQVASGHERWIYAIAGAFLDGLKTILPVVIATLLAGRISAEAFARAFFATVLFLGIGAWSLTCALGLYAMAKSEKVSGVEMLARITATDAEALRDRLAIVIAFLIEISAGFGACLIRAPVLQNRE